MQQVDNLLEWRFGLVTLFRDARDKNEEQDLDYVVLLSVHMVRVHIDLELWPKDQI